jgi:UDP-glucose 4-epimerase
MTPPAGFSPAAYMGVRALVLGASGFIGRWVARRLTGLGARLHLVVRNPAAAAEVFSRYGISGQVHVVDLRERSAVRHLLASVRPAITFNLAGYGVDPTERDEAAAYDINLRLVEAAAEAITAIRGPARSIPLDGSGWPGLDFVHAGSALEYGAIPGDLAEESQPDPTTLYGRSKLAGTRALAERSARGDLSAVTARLFTVYGPGERARRLLPSLLDAARTGRPLALTSGRQERDFTYVEDVADGLIRLGTIHQNRFDGLADPSTVVNLATGRLTAVRDFVTQGATLLGMREDDLLFDAIPTRAEEMHHDPVSLERLRHLLHWAPQTTVADGIRRTWTFAQGRQIDAVNEIGAGSTDPVFDATGEGPHADAAR